MKKSHTVRSLVFAVSLLLQLSPLTFHARGAAGDVDLSFDPGSGVTNPASVVMVQPDGKVLVGGPLTFINGTNRYGTARLNADGSLDSTFFSDTSFNPGFGVVHPRDCGPQFNCYDIAWATAAAIVHSGGKLLVGVQTDYSQCDPFEGGCFISTTYSVVRLNANGSSDPSFAFTNVFNNVARLGRVKSIAVQPDGKVVVGSDAFNPVRIARLNADGSWDDSFNPGTGPLGGVYSVALQPDGKILIGGSFTAVNGTNRNRIARLSADGALDDSFNPGPGVSDGSVSSISLQPDGKVLIGGDFTLVNGTSRNRIARLNSNGTLDSSFNPGTGANGVVRSIALQSDGNVLIGGDFTTVNGVARPYVARLYGDSIVVPSLNIARSNAFVIVSWPVTGLNFQLQESTNVSLPNAWSLVAQARVTNGAQISVTVPVSAPRKFFRLKSQ